MNTPTEISVSTWFIVGGRWYRRSSLPWDHKGSEYSYIKNELNLRPEDYGVYKNQEDMLELDGKSRAELIDELITLREQFRAIERAGF
jgi:hypothetical protein